MAKSVKVTVAQPISFKGLRDLLDHGVINQNVSINHKKILATIQRERPPIKIYNIVYPTEASRNEKQKIMALIMALKNFIIVRR